MATGQQPPTGLSAVRPMSLANRVTWALTGSVALFLLVICLLAYEAFAQMEDDLVDEVLAGQVQALRDDLRAQRNPSTVLSARASDGGRIQAWVLPADARPPEDDLFDQAAGARELHRDGRTWHTWVEAVPQGRLYVLYDATAHEDRVRAFGGVLAAGAVAALICAWLLARRLARRVVAPIGIVSERLSAWSRGGAPAPAPRGDEAAQLIEAFNCLQDHVDRSMAFERQFAANLSHELRTPLAALRTDVEMALLETASDSPLCERLQRMLTQIDAAAASLSEAVAMNSIDPARIQSVDLAGALDEAWFAMQPTAQARGLTLLNRVPPGSVCRLDPYALLIVLRNLLRNAIEHAAPATLTVGLAQPATLRFHDDGPGIPAERLARLREWRDGRTDLKSSSPTETGGLGLAIAQRVCELQGWELAITSSHADTPSWTEVRLILPPDAPRRPEVFSASRQQNS
ncbi:HAMP domain-containing sensor histidine kinase [Castellaniella sp. GW247-6E4]|uniref:sensor histidine kinase n=1 Tax=Castellaniella sp. GW247-6E4 TaxID=3140380 RepID=UPI003314F96C